MKNKPIIYGIPNCDTIKKTFSWLKTNNIDFDFHNYKTDGISAAKLKEWCTFAPWQNLLNKKSTTWKNTAVENTGCNYNASCGN